jgi:uncharacterized protein YcbX
MPELKVSQLWIYPIKSLGGISLTSANVLPKGFQYDRRWMLVDENGRFLTQRVHPIMSLFKLTLDNNQLLIRYRDLLLSVSTTEKLSSNSLRVTIWDDVVSAYEVNSSYSKWFADILGFTCKLVFFPEQNERPVDPVYKVNDEHVSLADAYPFLIIGQASLDELNARLSEAVPINRFRPNLVFTGGDPYEEDSWTNFTIGTTNFVGVKRCARCVMTTVNQDTAEKGVEPLKTLSSYRKRENKIYFGQNLIALNGDTVNVGDVIHLQ